MNDDEKRALIERKITQHNEWIADQSARRALLVAQVAKIDHTVQSDQVLLQVFTDELARLNAPPPPEEPTP